MDQEKFGRFIKKLRKKYNLTQKQLADKYNVTYQAVSKWENGLNMPDTALMKQISKDFDISIDELLDGEYKKVKKRKTYLFFTLLFTIMLVTISIYIFIFKPFKRDGDFQFKTLSTNCENFTISGNIAYNDNKSAIYINNIKYCGGDDTENYKKIECILYETNNDIDKKISSYNYEKQGSIKLEDFLQEVTLTIDNYESTCREYKNNALYLSVLATTQEDKVITYKVPLKLDASCPTN